MALQKKGIIVDAEVFYKFVDLNNQDSKPIHKCIKKQKLILVYGNDKKSLDEIRKNNKMKKMIAQFKENGVAYQVNSKEYMQKMEKTDIKSNDTHILAIALKEKKARLLFSGEDKKLHKDFTNPQIINNPRGQIYKNKTHFLLLPS